MEDGASIVPMVNQFELHVELQQRELVDYCRQLKIITQAYSPFGGNEAPVLRCLASFQRPAAAVALKAAAHLADSVVLKSAKPERIQTNLDYLSESWHLTDEELKKMSMLNLDKHYCWDPYTVS
jgi:diketogulonate reductase-like aldo/keto reductase